MFSRILMPCVALLAALLLNRAAPAQEPMQLRLATFGPPTSYFYVEVVLPWADAVSRDSQGTIEIKHFGGGVIANAGNMLDRVLNGVADLGWTLQGFTPQIFVKTTVNEVPFSHETSEEGAVALWRTYANGIIASDYAGLEVFGTSSFAGTAFISRRPVRNLEDVKGMKVSVSGKGRADMITALGGVPLAMPIDEVFMAINRRTIDGTFGSLTAVRSFRFHEVAKYFLDESFSGAAAMLAMSKQKFDSLPEPARMAFRKHSGEALSRALGVSNNGEMDRARAFLSDLERQGSIASVARLTPEERERWRKALDPIVEAWVKNVPDGQHVLDAYRAEVVAVRAAKQTNR
jgi:TRAP-type C4-dicarboxylate transport system substrate-binding protein